MPSDRSRSVGNAVDRFLKTGENRAYFDAITVSVNFDSVQNSVGNNRDKKPLYYLTVLVKNKRKKIMQLG